MRGAGQSIALPSLLSANHPATDFDALPRCLSAAFPLLIDKIFFHCPFPASVIGDDDHLFCAVRNKEQRDVLPER